MRILFLLLIGFLMASAHEEFITTAHIRILPKIMALDTRLSQKSAIPKSVFAIIYDTNQKFEAQRIAEEINKTYNGKVANIAFQALPLSVNEAIERKDIAFAYVIQKCTDKGVKKVADWGIQNTVPVFSYDVADLELGVLGSVAIERSTIIYINKTSLREGKFRFDEALYRIARFIE